MVDLVCKKWKIAISVEKSKVLAVGSEEVNAAILEEVESFTYLGSSIPVRV